MKKRSSLLLLVAALLVPPSQAQKPSEELNKELPKWLKFSGEFRARLEGYSGGSFRDNSSDAYYLNRLRINLLLQPASWIKIFAQTQDARVAFKNTKPAAPPYQDTWDLRQAYLELGNSEKGIVGVRTGRQELNFGEQRLIGSADWNNTARSFDAVRVTLRPLSGVRVDAFASSVVVLQDGAFITTRTATTCMDSMAVSKSWFPVRSSSLMFSGAYRRAFATKPAPSRT